MKTKKEKIIRQKDSQEEEIRHMLEIYTMVPPSPGTKKRSSPEPPKRSSI